MRWIFAAWALPMGIFWGWYFLSLNDMNFGYVMLTRQVHDLLFQLYGEMLGVEPATIPPLVAKACILDTLLILAIWAFRRRQAIAAWFRAAARALFRSGTLAERVKPVEHALQDEGGGRRIDLAGALLARKIHLDQRALRRHRRQPLVPEHEGQVGHPRHVAHEGARRLRARSLASRPC